MQNNVKRKSEESNREKTTLSGFLHKGTPGHVYVHLRTSQVDTSERDLCTFEVRLCSDSGIPQEGAESSVSVDPPTKCPECNSLDLQPWLCFVLLLPPQAADAIVHWTWLVDLPVVCACFEIGIVMPGMQQMPVSMFAGANENRRRSVANVICDVFPLVKRRDRTCMGLFQTNPSILFPQWCSSHKLFLMSPCISADGVPNFQTVAQF